MNITLPASKRTTGAQLVLALLALLALAIVAGVTTSDFGSKPPAPRASISAPISSEVDTPAASLTFVLVGSQAEADYLLSLRAEAGDLVDARAALQQVVILPAGTPEQEAAAMETMREASEAALSAPSMPVHVVDARNVDLMPR